MENFNRAKAYKKYYADSKKEREFFENNGLTGVNLEIIMEMTQKEFKGTCVHYSHNLSLDVFVETMEEEGMSPLLKKNSHALTYGEDRFTYEMDMDKYIDLDWTAHIEDKRIRSAVKKLKPIELKILTGIAIEGKKINEVAESIGLTRQWTSKKYKSVLAKIKEAIEK